MLFRPKVTTAKKSTVEEIKAEEQPQEGKFKFNYFCGHVRFCHYLAHPAWMATGQARVGSVTQQLSPVNEEKWKRINGNNLQRNVLF